MLFQLTAGLFAYGRHAAAAHYYAFISASLRIFHIDAVP